MPSKKTALGKGLESLIPTNFDQSLLLEKSERVQNLFISDIEPNPAQPRKHFDVQALTELSESIQQYGVLQPLIVTPRPDGRYTIVAGERRWRAAKQANLKQVPAVVRDRAELEQLEVALIENVQRVDLSPLEQAVSIARLHEQFNLSYQDIAKRLGKAETTVSNIVRLLGLPEEAREALANQEISEGHARAILSLKAQPKAQQELLQHIIKENWSVRQAEQFVSNVKKPKARQQSAKKSVSTETPATKKLANKLGLPVKLRHRARGSVVEIYVEDNELDSLLKKLSQ